MVDKIDIDFLLIVMYLDLETMILLIWIVYHCSL